MLNESSAKELMKAVSCLTGTSVTGMNGLVDGNHFYEGTETNPGPGIQYAITDADRLANSFSKNNTELSQGWKNVSAFSEAIYEELKKVLGGVAAKINEFSTDTFADEANAAQATETAKSKADDILGRLGLNK